MGLAGVGHDGRDASGNGNTGTIANATWTSAGKFGSALSFNGTNARVTIPDASSLQLRAAMTLEAWVNPATVTSAWRDVIYKGNDNYFLDGHHRPLPAAGRRRRHRRQLRQSSPPARCRPTPGRYLALTYDGATVRLYLNGAQVASHARTGAITTSTNPLTLGGDPFYGQYFNGLIDKIRIYNIALTAAADPDRHDHPGRRHAGHDPAHGARHPHRQRRQLAPRSTSAGAPRPTTSASPTT